jgi:UDP:flavonoid glycosyltransferase YjiC (YdhE family)
MGETFFLDPAACPTINTVRSEYDLAPIRHISQWWHSPQCILGFFPAWYAPPQPDWPRQFVQCDFPLWDELAEEALAPEIEDFLQAGEPPLVFTPGSANLFGSAFFRAAAESCRLLGRRGMLCSRFGHHVPSTLPPGVQHFDYVPFSRLLPRAAAVIHHGGIGTTSQSLAAGIPQLIMPISHDQPDNAYRVRQLGVGDVVWPRRFNPSVVARTLSQLLSDPEVPRVGRQIADRIRGVDPYQKAIQAIEQFAADQRK